MAMEKGERGQAAQIFFGGDGLKGELLVAGDHIGERECVYYLELKVFWFFTCDAAQFVFA